MSEDAQAALYAALNTRLGNAGKCWGDRVYADLSDSNQYPYAVFFWSGGGEANRTRREDAEFVITAKAVSTRLSEAFLGSRQIADLLNDHGEQDNTTDFLYGGADWRILTVTREGTIYAPDMFSSAVPIYHAGALYRVIMEAR